MVRTITMRHWRASLTAATMLAGIAIPFLADPGSAFAQAGAEWTTQRGDSQGTAFSSLSEINDSNVGKLVEDFSLPTGTFENHEGSPLVVGNVMYITTPFPNNLIAIDLANHGKILWTYDPGTYPGARAQACCDFDNRGAAYVTKAEGAPSAHGELIYNALDGNVHGVDAVTGQRIWMTKVANTLIGETTTGAPIVAHGIAMVGNSGAEDGARGAVFGINVTTGAVVWKGYNTGPDSEVLIDSNTHPYYAKDQGTNLGVTSWNGTSWWKQGGATAWGYKTYDPVNNIFIYGSGNADPWSAVYRGGQGDAKWAASIFARRPETGKVVWVTQLTPDDQWDYDSISESVVADITINGARKHVLFHVDKNGYGYTLDAATGQMLVVGDVTAAGNGGVSQINWSTGVNLKTGKPAVVPSHILRGIEDPLTGKNIIPLNCPGPAGVKDEEPISYSLQTHLAYIPAHSECLGQGDVQANWIAGTPFTAFTVPGGFTAPGSPGFLVAWNPATGSPAWTINEPYWLWSGVLSTAGNLVVYGTLSNGTDAAKTPTVKIVNATTGALLWSTILECNTVGNPMAFIGADGHERIATFTGTGGTGASGTGKCPNLTIFHPGKYDNSKTMTWLGEEKKVMHPGASTVTSGYVHVWKLP
jgi:PQQ-dependent dehydrogenase (methanol/ethanol family)